MRSTLLSRHLHDPLRYGIHVWNTTWGPGRSGARSQICGIRKSQTKFGFFIPGVVGGNAGVHSLRNFSTESYAFHLRYLSSGHGQNVEGRLWVLYNLPRVSVWSRRMCYALKAWNAVGTVSVAPPRGERIARGGSTFTASAPNQNGRHSDAHDCCAVKAAGFFSM